MKHTHTTTVLLMKGLSAKTTRSKNNSSVITRVMKHNHRLIQSEIGLRDGSNIDISRMKDNFILRGGDTPALVDAEVNALMAGVFVAKWRIDTICAIELVFGLPVDSLVEPREYFEKSTQWAERFFQCKVVSSVVHLDEDAPHCHVILLPIIGGRLLGSSVMGNPEKMRHMQADYYNQVCKGYGFAPRKPKERFTKDVRVKALGLAFASLQANSGLHDDVINALLKPHYRDPSDILKQLNISIPEPEIKGTFAGIMTKKVKPDLANSNTMGVDALHRNFAKSKPIVVGDKINSILSQPLLSVGVPTTKTALLTEPKPIQIEEACTDFLREHLGFVKF